MKKLFITGPREIVSAFLLRNIEKGYELDAMNDSGDNATVTLKEATNDK
jgi:hypothetical protein